MRAGSLRHLITIQRRQEYQDATGAVLWTWVPFATVHAAIRPLVGREYWGAAQVQSEITTEIRIRYLPGIHPKMRIVHSAERGSPSLIDYYDVEAVQHIREEGRELVLMCRSSDAEGFRNG